jgi:hypothetical protein
VEGNKRRKKEELNEGKEKEKEELSGWEEEGGV